ncbi:hypothetical protein ACFY1A_21140 [Streptomyces sp. NPDC001520]|uniref:hypothetical protein n=1 Tax=Streptomyces sp. NPDC001520 TaxID=3364581 RepID=UPI00367F32DA
MTTADLLTNLLAEMRAQGGIWTTRRVMNLPPPLGTTQRSIARQRLGDLADRGDLLIVLGRGRSYRVNQAKGGAR